MNVKEWKLKPTLKRNLMIAAILVFVGAAAWFNWSYNRSWGAADTAMSRAEDKMTAEVSAAAEGEARPTAQISEYFAHARLTRQQSRDQALSLLETAASSQGASGETIDAAMNELTKMANWALLESRIENELLAKNFSECVVYFSADGCTVAVPSPEEGLDQAEVARITDAVTANSEYTAAQINVIEVFG